MIVLEEVSVKVVLISFVVCVQSRNKKAASDTHPRHAQHYLGLALLIVQTLPYTCRVGAQRWVVADPWMRQV